MKKTCPHCDPYERAPGHWLEKLEKLLAPAFWLFAPIEKGLKKFPGAQSFLNRLVFNNLFRLLLLLRVLKEADALAEAENLYNRSLIIIKEARKRGLVVKNLKGFNQNTNFFSIIINGKKIFFEGLPTLPIDGILKVDLDDKLEFKKLLLENNLPCPVGRTFSTCRQAIKYAGQIGFPVVVKPRAGSLSQHAVFDIKNEIELRAAIKIVKKITGCFLLEKFVAGEVYRITMVDNKLAAACRREAPNVIGNGQQTIEELIKIKNDDSARGHSRQKNCSLHKIKVTAKTMALLATEGFNLKTVIPKDKKVYLHNKIILACGADVHDVTENVHPANRRLFEKAAQLCRLPVVGLDFICRDIAVASDEQEGGIIEANSLPYIDMHHYPVTGQSRDVAKLILDCLLK